MKKNLFLSIALILSFTIAKAQTAYQFSGYDCKGKYVNLFQDLDSGKAVVLFYYMPSCGTCPPPASKIQAMTKKLSVKYPGKIKGYAFPFQNSTTCDYSSTWVSSNNLSELYTPMDSGASHLAQYGGFGMPTVVLVGGKDHKVLFSTLSFNTSDTSIMKSEILKLFGSSASSRTLSDPLSKTSIFPNPVNQTANISVEISEPTPLLIEILDIFGRPIKIIYNDFHYPGHFNFQFNTSDLPNGVCLLKIQTSQSAFSRVIVIKNS